MSEKGGFTQFQLFIVSMINFHKAGSEGLTTKCESVPQMWSNAPQQKILMIVACLS